MRSLLCGFLTLVAVPLLTASAPATNKAWLNYTNGDVVQALDSHGQSLWLSTVGGLVRLDLETGDRLFLNKANSGLPNNVLGAVHVDRFGQVWVVVRDTFGSGRGGGLARFDGHTWVVYTPSSSDLPSKDITALATDRLGNLWAASRSGLLRFDGTRWIGFTPADFGLEGEGVSALAIDDRNNVWFAVRPRFDFIPNDFNPPCRGGGLVRFDGSEWKTYTTESSGLPSRIINTLAVDDRGVLWIGASDNSCSGTPEVGGVIRFDGHEWVAYNTSNSDLPTNDIVSLDVAPNGLIWATTRQGPVSFDGHLWVLHDLTDLGIPGQEMGPIHVTEDGDVWISSRGWGAVHFDGSTWSATRTSNSGLPCNGTNQYEVRDIVTDRTGTQWIALGGGGLVKKSGSDWEVLTTENSGLPADRVATLALDADDNLWIGTIGGGLAHYDRQNWTVYNSSNSGLEDNVVQSLVIDHSGVLWLGGANIYTGGVTRFDGATWTYYRSTNSALPSIDVEDLALDAEGRVLAATNWGLARFNGEDWDVLIGVSYTKGQPDQRVFVTAVDVDPSGSVWIGTNVRGIAKWDENTWTFLDASNSGLPSNFVHSLTHDAGGNLWVGTCGGGVGRFDGRDWTVFTDSNSGLVDQYCVGTIHLDPQDHAWFGTQYGGIAVYQGAQPGPEPPRPPILLQNYPNPFATGTTIRFDLPVEADAVLAVHDINGRLIRQFVIRDQGPGQYKRVWDGRDEAGRTVSSGVYFYILNSRYFHQSRRMVLLRDSQ